MFSILKSTAQHEPREWSVRRSTRRMREELVWLEETRSDTGSRQAKTWELQWATPRNTSLELDTDQGDQGAVGWE